MQYQKQWEFLEGKFESGNLGHAYIFAGRDGVGIKSFTKEFVDLIGCKFPDVMTTRAEDGSIIIKQVREIQDFLAYKSYNGDLKTVIIEDAERMTNDAQDCFLKSLEEPKGKTLIMLLTNKPEMLLPTITSRCQTINFLGNLRIEAELDADLHRILDLDLAEKFKYVKSANLEGENFQHILTALQNHFRKDIVKYKEALKLTLDLECQAQVSNLNTKLALEILLLAVNY